MIKLWLPVLFPSWRFFNQIGPSPRIEYGFGDQPNQWHPFRPRPQMLHWRTLLLRLFYNPRWNEYLYMTCCAERLLEQPNTHGVDEIFARIHWAIRNGEITPPHGASLLSFRVLIVERGEQQISSRLAFLANSRPLQQEPPKC